MTRLPPFTDRARALLQAAIDDDQMPSESEQRVWERLQRDRVGPPPMPKPLTRWLWVGGLVAAAALIAVVIRSVEPEWRSAIESSPGELAQDGALPPSNRGHVVNPEPKPDMTSADFVPPADGPRPEVDGRRVVESAERDSDATPRRDPTAQDRGAISKEGSSLAEERSLIASAWLDLSRGDAEQALLDAQDHRRRFPHGVLTPERDAISAIAGCRLARRDAMVEALEFRSRHPASALAAQVRAACEKPQRPQAGSGGP